MFWLSYECFSVLCYAFLLKSVISGHNSCGNKGLKAKISCFFSCFLCLTCLRLECSRIRKTTEFHKWSESVVHFENHQFLKGNCKFLSVI